MTRSISVHQRVLSNGLHIYLIHKPDFVKSLFMCGFGVGGTNIQEKQDGVLYKNPSGCAHFLEHQMFRLNGQDVTDAMSAMSASTNAFTAHNETAYYFTTSADPLPPLGLLLDFVQTLDITDETVEKEKGIILSEYRMYDQSADSRLMTETLKSLYEYDPLNTDILGTPEDIQNMKRQDLERFYAINYDPSKMILVGISGHDPEKIFQFVEEHEKNYPCKNHVQAIAWHEPEPLQPVRRQHTLQLDVSTPYACVGFKLKPQGTPLENARRDLVFNIWLDGTFSPLNPEYQKWLDERIITQTCGAEADLTPDHAYALFYAQSEKPRQFMELALRLAREKKPLPQETFEALKRQNIASGIRLRDQFHALATQQLEAALRHLDFETLMALPSQITWQDMADVLDSLDFSQYTETVINPLETGN